MQPPHPDTNELSLYIHIPWCVRKCPYCDFNSHQQKSELPEEEYVSRLLADLSHDIDRFAIDVNQRPIYSIFFGGGTPSLFSADAIKKILDGVSERIPLSDECEITLEANPGTFEAERFKGFRQAGVNRLSIGIQSFANKHLKKLGRIHDKDEAKKAVSIAFNSGFDNVNLDLMYALPEQSIDSALNDLMQAFEFPITHLSHYQLTLEPNTLFAKFPPKVPEDDDIWEMQQVCQSFIAEKGFQQYEVSAYAKPYKACEHNQNYWRFGDYLGIGAGAHGKITNESGITRTAKPRHPRQYLENAIDEKFVAAKKVEEKDIAFEYFLNQLRLHESFSEQSYQRVTGLNWSEDVHQKIESAIQQAWLENTDGSYRVTAKGLQFLNNLQGLFL